MANTKASARFLHSYGPYSSAYTHPLSLWFEKWFMRVVSIVFLLISAAISLLLYPFLLAIGLVADIVRYKKVQCFVCCRIATFFNVYFLGSLAGVVLFFSLYLWSLVANPTPKQWREWNYRFQSVWGKYIFYGGCVWALGLKVRTELPKEGLGDGPKIFFMRHASFADVLVPQGLFASEYGMRYIVKKQLLWDPALNIGGSRTPNFFLYREIGAEGMAVELQGMRNLVKDFTPTTNSITCIWPEGTRFTPKKKQQILETLKKKDINAHDKAAQLQHTLLPRLGGALALLEANPCADVFFVAHVGLDDATDLSKILTGKTIGADVVVKFFRVKYKDIPTTKEEQTEWMFRNWLAMDKWIGEKMAHREGKKFK